MICKFRSPYLYYTCLDTPSGEGGLGSGLCGWPGPQAESADEATEEVQKHVKEKEEDTEDAFHPQDPVQETEQREKEESVKEQDQIVVKAIKLKGLKNRSSSSRTDLQE